MLSNNEMCEHKRTYTPSQILDYFTIDLHSFFSFFFLLLSSSSMHKPKEIIIGENEWEKKRSREERENSFLLCLSCNVGMIKTHRVIKTIHLWFSLEILCLVSIHANNHFLFLFYNKIYRRQLYFSYIFISI